MKILSIKIKRETDTNPDTSWIGEYTDKCKPWNIVCQTGEFCEKIDQRKRMVENLESQTEDLGEYENSEIRINQLLARIEKIKNSGPLNYPERNRNHYYFFEAFGSGELTGSKLYREYALRDFEEMEKLQNGDFQFLIVWIEARIQITTNGPIQTITSGSLGGIDSRMKKDEMQEIIDAQKKDLFDQLSKIGFSEKQLSEIEIEEED